MENVTKTVPSILLIGTIVRVLVVGAQISDSLIVIALCGLVYLLNSLKLNKKAVEVQQQMSDLTELVEQLKQENSDVKAYVSSVKMSTSLSGKR